jgi:class 3 adenylate cyclase
MRSLSKLTDEAVLEQGGVVQSFTGDGITAVFGAPRFEDVPRHSIHDRNNIHLRSTISTSAQK